MELRLDAAHSRLALADVECQQGCAAQAVLALVPGGHGESLPVTTPALHSPGERRAWGAPGMCQPPPSLQPGEPSLGQPGAVCLCHPRVTTACWV